MRCAAADEAHAAEWKAAAVAALSQAVRLGWRDRAALNKNLEFEVLKDLPEYKKILGEIGS